MRMAKLLAFLLLTYPVIGGQPEGGSGNEYLKQTEQGQAWFTGSCGFQKIICEIYPKKSSNCNDSALLGFWTLQFDKEKCEDWNSVKFHTFFCIFLACECNGWTSRCRFNEYYYSLTGRGGECLECDGHRDGQHCERCKPNHFFSPNQDDQGRIPCEPCNCDSTGMSYRLSQQVLNEFVLTLETILHFHFKFTCVLIWLRLETTPMCSGWQMRM